jgi:stage V sporulation protein D (sporulation-specific penicillin-binding protein)
MAASRPRSRPLYRPDCKRSLHLSGLIWLGLVVVAVRLISLQAVSKEHYLTEVAPKIATTANVTLPRPGNILGHNHEILATSTPFTTIRADPTLMHKKDSPSGAAEQLGKALGRPREEILSVLTKNPHSKDVTLIRWADPQTAQAVRNLKIRGLFFQQQWKRQYPANNLACHILGGRDRRHLPLDGLESRYQLILDGKPGSNPGQSLSPLSSTYNQIPPQAGKSLVLTIEPDLQRKVEVEIDAVWTRERPKWVSCVVEDPRSGAILAMATKPDYNVNDYAREELPPGYRWSAVPKSATQNIPVSEVVEHGSTFKLLLAAAALDKGVIKPETRFYCGGSLDLGGKPIGCWGEWGTRGHGSLDLAGMLANSCNICAAQISLRLGKTAYREFLDRAGIAALPDSGLPGEVSGQLPPLSAIRPRDLASMGFGQNVSCSNLQLTAIVSGLVNGGVKMRPHIIDSALNADGSLYHKIPPQEEVRLCSEQTSATLREMMARVVEQGTGRSARIEGFRVGGKTGTAQQWNPDKKRHYSDRHMVSFILAAPIDQPRYVIHVACNEPKVGRHGSEVAAPIARRVAEYALRQFETGKDLSPQIAQP